MTTQLLEEPRLRPQTDRLQFLNEDLSLRVSKTVDPAKWDERRYEAFLDGLCSGREYQKDAIKVALRYLLGGQYTNLRALARSNFDAEPILAERYGSWDGMQRQLQFPDHLSASLDMATGTGKSYVMYGIAAIMIAEGAIDSALVLCPSTTIEDGLIAKFTELAVREDLRAVMPPNARFAAPSIINGSSSIVSGSICVENYHAILEHVGSSLRGDLQGKGARTLILNDEAHHVANETAGEAKRWKEFVSDPKFGFRYVIGVSGTCYVKNDYFSDVIFRYSLKKAIEERVVKWVEYVADMERTGAEDEKWQLIRGSHEDIRGKLKPRSIRPMTIIVTPTIERCKSVTEELKAYLVETEQITSDEVNDRVLCIHSKADDLPRLPMVDLPSSTVEWIVSVSMLTEGWDVKRVFQIVPHEERAFNSKLLIAQVLGRGLRVPDNWGAGPQPIVTVFNHHNWAGRIRQLVNEVLEREKEITSQVVPTSQYNFSLHNIDYSLTTTRAVTSPMTGPYTLLEKGYTELPADTAEESVSGTFECQCSGGVYHPRTGWICTTERIDRCARVIFARFCGVFCASFSIVRKTG